MPGIEPFILMDGKGVCFVVHACMCAVYYVMINSTENKAGEVEVVYYYAE